MVELVGHKELCIGRVIEEVSLTMLFSIYAIGGVSGDDIVSEFVVLQHVVLLFQLREEVGDDIRDHILYESSRDDDRAYCDG